MIYGGKMKQFAVSMDEGVMKRFDNAIGDVTRSACIRRLVINELDRLENIDPIISGTTA